MQIVIGIIGICAVALLTYYFATLMRGDRQ